MSCFRGMEPWDHPNTLYIERVGFQDLSTVIVSSDFFRTQTLVIEKVVDFELKDAYMFASSKVVGVIFSLWRSTLILGVPVYTYCLYKITPSYKYRSFKKIIVYS